MQKINYYNLLKSIINLFEYYIKLLDELLKNLNIRFYNKIYIYNAKIKF